MYLIYKDHRPQAPETLIEEQESALDAVEELLHQASEPLDRP